MNKEFRYAKGWLILTLTVGPLMIFLFGSLCYVPLLEDELNWNLVFIIYPVSIGMILLMLKGLLEAIKTKYIIDENQIIHEGVFRKKVLKFSEIKGYKSVRGIIWIIPNREDLSKIVISQYIGNKLMFYAWLFSKYIDLDKK